jgi:hypothetical protein
MKDKVEERKEKLKPTKLFSVVCVVYDDSVLAGQLISLENCGRLKNQKIMYTGADAGKDFLSNVRSVIPSSIPYIQDLVMRIEKDSDIQDCIDTEKIAKVTVDIFSDSIVTCDFCELIKKDRGAPKAWRKEPKTFIADLKLQVGNLVEVFKPLLEANTTSLDTTSTVDELTKPTKTGGYVAGDLDVLPTNDYEENDDDFEEEDDE